MQSPCSCFIFSSECARYSFFAQLEQFFALSFGTFEPALPDRPTLLSLLVAKIQFAEEVTHAAASSTAPLSMVAP
jgi:hypothetical protein